MTRVEDKLMAARKPAKVRPVDAALLRLMELAAKNVAPTRMAREVEVVVSEWRRDPEATAEITKERLDELHAHITAGVAHAEEQVSDADTSDAAAVKQARQTLSALVATRDAAREAMAAA